MRYKECASCIKYGDCGTGGDEYISSDEQSFCIRYTTGYNSGYFDDFVEKVKEKRKRRPVFPKPNNYFNDM